MTVRTLARTFRRTMSQAIDLAHPAFPSSTAVAGNVVAWPGVTHESTAAVRDLLEQNDRRFHIWMKTTCERVLVPLGLESNREGQISTITFRTTF